jgi:hypothetical protein
LVANPDVELLGLEINGNSMFTFWGTIVLFSTAVSPFYIPHIPAMLKGANLSTSLPPYVIFSFLKV